jgi:hypothetical protein
MIKIVNISVTVKNNEFVAGLQDLNPVVGEGRGGENVSAAFVKNNVFQLFH